MTILFSDHLNIYFLLSLLWYLEIPTYMMKYTNI